MVFEGVVGRGYLGDVAIDDITYRSGACAITPPNAVPASLTTLTPPTTTPTTTNTVTATSCE